MTLAEWTALISAVGTSLGAIAVFAAAWVGRDTFQNWRKQKGEERRMELADELLLAAYACRENLAYARNAVLFGDERDAAEKELERINLLTVDTSAGDRQRRIHAQVVLTKLLREEGWDTLRSLRSRCKAMFGDSIEGEIESILVNRQKTIFGAQRHARLREPGPNAPDRFRQQFEAKCDETEKIIWTYHSNEEPDPIKTSMDRSVTRLERALLPIIRGGSEPLKLAPD